MRAVALAGEEPPPAPEHVVDVRSADDGLFRARQRDRGKDERSRLRTAHSAVEGDQLLERAALVEVGVVEAPGHDVGDMRKAVRAEEVARRVGRERCEWILALDPAVFEVVLPARAE